MRMFRPINEFILVQRMEEPVEDTGKTKLVLPDSANPEFMYGEVLAVGEGAVTQTGQRMPFGVKPGDRIYFTERGSQLFRELGDIWKMTERAVVGVLDGDNTPDVPFA